MIQIGRLTTFKDDNGDDVQYLKMVGLNYPSLKELFKNVDKDLADRNRKNLFYTVAHHLQHQRKFDSWQAQEIIPFDLDGIDLNRIDEYVPLACSTLGIDQSKCGVVYTGNGIHILVQVERWECNKFIKQGKLGYRQLVDRLDEAYKDAGLPFTKDTTAWDYGRVLRCPFTENHKLKDGETVIKKATLINGDIEQQDFKVPVLDKPKDDFSLEKGQFPMPDAGEIVTSCEFFKWLGSKPDEVHEPHAYAMLSIAGHFNDDLKTAKGLWDNFSSPSIDSKDFNEFTEQALTTSGPRTCEGINNIWGACRTCKHYGEVKSPIMLKGANFIGTEHCGFTLIGPKGGKIRQYEDLRKFYSRETKYINITDIKRVMVYSDGLYKKTNPDEIKAFSQKQFVPLVESDKVRTEFLNQVKAGEENQKDISFIQGEKNEGLINLANGVYDLKLNTLLEHSHEYGFLYKLPYEYDANATCPTWDKLLKNLTLDRPELINLIEEAIAYTIGGVPYTTFQHYFLLTGGGSNGKTTFINAFKMLLGNENTVSIKLANLLSKEYYTSMLEGKLANMVADEDSKAFEKNGADATLLKALTGGDTVSARAIYEGPMQFVNRAKFFYAFNEIPQIGIKSHGDLRRPIIIPFDAQLDKMPNLKIDDLYGKLEGELSGILNRIIIAYGRLMLEGFTKSPITAETLKVSRVEHDAVYDFLTNECKVKSDGFSSYAELFNAFDNDSMYQNENYRVSKRVFCRRIRSTLSSENNYDACEVVQKRIGAENIKGVLGIAMNQKLQF